MYLHLLMKTSITLLFLTVSLLVNAQTLEGNYKSPYKKIEASRPQDLLPLVLKNSSDSLYNILNSKEYLWGEVQALLYEFKQYNFSAPAAVTDGRHNFEQAERPFLAMIYTGMAICNLVEKYPEFKPQAREEMRWLVTKIQLPAVSGFITPHFGAPFGKQPIQQSSVLVHGHFLNLALRYRQAFPSAEFDSIIHKVATALARDYGKHSLLPSYPDMFYPADNIVALAALKNYDRIFKKNISQKPVETFLTETKANYLDKTTILVSSYVNPKTKTQLAGPRGEATMYGLIYLSMLDYAFAREQWAKTKQYFIRNLPSLFASNKLAAPYLPMIKSIGSKFYISLQKPVSYPSTGGDGDSGPVIFGAGTSASGFAIASARALNDAETATGFERLAVSVGNPVWVDNRLYYSNLFHPVGQAIILFGKTLH